MNGPMRALSAFLALAMWASVAAPVFACTPPLERQYPNQPADYRRFAEAILKEARYVEVVQVVSAVPVTAPEAWDRWLNVMGRPGFGDEAAARAAHKANRNKPVGVVFRLTVVERLKGSGPGEIVLEGGGTAPPPDSAGSDEELRHVIRDGRPAPVLHGSGADELDLPDALVVRSTCSPSLLRLAPGQRYLIFRGRDGRLLKTASGYRLMPIASSAGPRHWLDAVRQAARGRR